MSKEQPIYKRRVRELQSWVDRLIDGDEPEALPLGRVRVAPQLSRATETDPEHASIRFHQPVRRTHRLATADGRTSFHFSHRTVVRLRSGSLYDGVLLRPGAASEHCRYVERESAVASVAPDPTLCATGLIAEQATIPQAYVETDNDLRPYAHHLALADDIGIASDRLYSADLYLAEPHPPGDGLRPMSGFNLASEGRHADRLLHGVPGIDLEGDADDDNGGLRRASDSSGSLAQKPSKEISGRNGRSLAADRQAYVERDAAVAIQPDGTAAIITNIAPAAEDRLEFWARVEEEESEPGPDRMTIDLEEAPEFWRRVANSNQCPVDLRDALQSPDPADRQEFIVSSGKDIRAFLSTIAGWKGRRDREEGESRDDYRRNGKGLATFHDGRGGRVQYRIVGELPSELSIAGRMRALRKFVQRFEVLKMPFNLAVHAPDHGNSEHQWHFHLDYYDRPCWRLTAEEVEAKRLQGYKPVGAGVGEWSFAAKFRRNGKTSRPFREGKVEERRARDWIERLRERLAFVTNEELKREGQHPRYDPRSYDQMGIKAEPGEHLGTKLSAAEGKGDVSKRSVSNEAKQWAAIQQQLEHQRDAGNLQITAATAFRTRRLENADLADSERKALAEKIHELDNLERSVIDIDHDTATAQHLTARACSRASKVQQVNQRWLDADEAGQCNLTPRLRLERASLRTAASEYLGRLEPLREVAREAISICDGVRASALAQKRILEGVIDTRLADAAAKAARMPTWLAQLDRERPLIALTREGYRLSGVQDADRMADTIAAQQALVARYARQEREVDALILTVEKDRRDLERRGGRWLFHHRDPAVVAQFGVLQHHPRIGKAINHAMSHPGSVDEPMRRSDGHHAASFAPASTPRVQAPLQPPRHARAAPTVGERSPQAAPMVLATQRSPAPMVAAAMITPSSLPSEQPALLPMATVPSTGPVKAPADTGPRNSAQVPSGAAAVIGKGDREVGVAALNTTKGTPAIPDNRTDNMAVAPKGAKVDPVATPRPVTANEPSVSRTSDAALPATTTTTSRGSAAPVKPKVSHAPDAPRVHSVQRLIAEKRVLRLDLNGQIDARALAQQGIVIADADRSNPRLVGRAREQRLYAQKVVENFVTKYPEFIVEADDLCSLSARAKPDVRAYFENHDDPRMQLLLRRRYDQHKAAEAARARDRSMAPASNASTADSTAPSLTSTLERDPAMIAAAQARARERQRQRGDAEVPPASKSQPSTAAPAAQQEVAREAPRPQKPGPRRPPPGWDGGFGR